MLVTKRQSNVGILTIRAWREGDDHHLRARLQLAPDVTREATTTEFAASVEEVCSIVRTWLDEIA